VVLQIRNQEALHHRQHSEKMQKTLEQLELEARENRSLMDTLGAELKMVSNGKSFGCVHNTPYSHRSSRRKPKQSRSFQNLGRIGRYLGSSAANRFLNTDPMRAHRHSHCCTLTNNSSPSWKQPRSDPVSKRHKSRICDQLTRNNSNSFLR